MSRTHIRTLELPRDSSHDINGVSSTHSNTDGTQATTIGSVGVCTNQHHSRIGIILQDDLSRERDVQSRLHFFPFQFNVFRLLFEMDNFSASVLFWKQEVILITQAEILFRRNYVMFTVKNLLKIPCRYVLRHTIMCFE